MSGTLLLNNIYAHVLLDFGASYPFVTLEFTKKLFRDSSKMDHVLCMITLFGYILHTNVILRNCPLTVTGKNIYVHLAKIEMQGFDVILGIDWLAKYQVTIDYKRKVVSLTTTEGEKFEHKGSNLKK